MFPLTPGSSLQSSGWIRSLGFSSRDEAWPSVWQMFPERLHLIHVALELLLWTGSCQRSGLVAGLCLARPLEQETGALWVCKVGASWEAFKLESAAGSPEAGSHRHVIPHKQLLQQVPCWAALVVILLLVWMEQSSDTWTLCLCNVRSHEEKGILGGQFEDCLWKRQ